MPTIDNYVNVVIDRQTQAVTQQGFGLQMFLGLGKGFTGRYKVYSSLSEVAVDFNTDAPEYKAAATAFGQEISADQFAIGRQKSDVATLAPVVANNTTYSVIINGTTFNFTSDASATATEIVAGLTAVINADGPLPVTASGTTTLILTPDVADTAYTLKKSDNLSVVYTATETLSAALAAIKLVNNDWYGLSCYSHVAADILAVAAVAEAEKKLYGASSSDAGIKSDVGTDTTSIAYSLKAAAYERTFLLFSGVANSVYPECGWLSQILVSEPGSYQGAFKTLNGVTVDSLTTSEYNNVLAKYANVYVSVAGVNHTYNGRVSSGEWCDVVRDLDYLEARLKEDIFSTFVRISKIPFTQRGANIIENEVRKRLQLAVDAGILADDTGFTVTVPNVLNVAANDRANRFLPDVKFTARIAGAIIKTTINGIVSV